MVVSCEQCHADTEVLRRCKACGFLTRDWPGVGDDVSPSKDKWDRRYLEMASMVASWSKDPSTKVGAVIVAPRHRIVSVGFNGFPRALPDRPEALGDRAVKYSRIIHAEINAMILAGTPIPPESTLYTWPFPSCDRCLVQLVQAGVTRFVAPTIPASLKDRWEGDITRAQAIAAECHVSFEFIEGV